ncbi:hypothetical protein BGZ76_011868 [Entomortierella beljakovae]|nr:hypothetical protein BGZ76_011868 [Entomortierella beljakovae]
MLSLLCVIDGKASEEAFSVSISKDDNVFDLQKLIMKKKPQEFGNLEPECLLIWKVDIQVPNNKESTLTLRDLDKKKLLRRKKRVSKAFEDGIPDNTISIIVATPQEGKKLEVYLRYNPNPTCAWVVWEANLDTSTTQELLDVIQSRYINIWHGPSVLAVHHPTRPAALRKSLGSVSYPENDKDLRLILSHYIRNNVDNFIVDLELPQVDFSEPSLHQVSQLLGLSEQPDPSADQLFPWDDTVQSASLESDRCKAVLDQLYEQLQTHLDLSGPCIEEVQEDFTSIYITQAAKLFKDQVILRRNMAILRIRGRGNVDMVLTSRDSCCPSYYACITTSQRNDTERGVARNILQLDSFPKRKRNASDLDPNNNDTMSSVQSYYGIVSDSDSWYFTNCQVGIGYGPSYSVSKSRHW